MTKLPREPLSSEITPQSLYLNRREFMKNAALTLGTASLVGGGLLYLVGKSPPPDSVEASPAGETANPIAASEFTDSGLYDVDEPQTSLRDVTTYNNFYEFGTDKSDPARNAQHAARPGPGRSPSRARWRSRRPSTSTTCSSWFPLEERVYRMRCVEAWSMVIPWVGFPLADADQAAGADRQREVRRVHDAAATRSRCPGQRDAGPRAGRTSRGCAWTRRCTR